MTEYSPEAVALARVQHPDDLIAALEAERRG